MATNNAASQAPHILMALILEIGGLAIVVAVAGISEGMATLMLIFVIGVAILWLMIHGNEVVSLQNQIGKIEAGAQ